MEIHPTAERLYRLGYRSEGGGGDIFHLDDPNGVRMIYFFMDNDKPLEHSLYTHDQVEMRMKTGGKVPDFSPPDCEIITDWLLVQMMMFGDTFDGFLCDLGQINDKCKLVADWTRQMLNQISEIFARRCLAETNSLSFIFAVELVASFCEREEILDKVECKQFLVTLHDLCKNKKNLSNYPR